MNKTVSIVLSVVLVAVLALAIVKFADTSVKGGVDFTDFYVRENVAVETKTAPSNVNANGVINDEEWKNLYPEVYNSYMANQDNSYTIEYLDQDPGLKEIYEGFGFAKSYLEARGHNYTIKDVTDTARPHALANCLTCKTADFTALVNSMGAEAYKLPFEEAAAKCVNNVGCYNCHANNAGNAGELVVTHDYMNTTLKEKNLIDADTLACGQCHIEYYFRPDDKGTEIPYTTVTEMDPTAILAFYDKIGFADYTQESTGAKLLKAQHPEMEMVLGNGNKHTALGITCADCHMATSESADGKVYISHKLVSPVDNSEEAATIRKNVCATCHGTDNMQAEVETIQENITAREKKCLAALVELKKKIVEAKNSGKYTDAELEAINYAYRAGEWFFDFCYVENSEGAHNSQLANECLAKSEAFVAQANKLFK